ncbi:Hypothetical protein NTJ_01199 [Nesidiocoris tenuis]|uniref:MD-2-related lipid-recognition domain-containing protein n=1 Tax=Nesidiocoris tenuis TaxID=355587 RepID=A0ABN7A7Y5_9HEMI|nr:Hypothetical protein NTJ_01199 [Nesidiocoris tenuis]
MLMTADGKRALGATMKSSIRIEMANVTGKYRTLLSLLVCFICCAGTTAQPDFKVTLEKLAPCNDKSSSLGDISGLTVSKINKTTIGFNGKVIANYDITDDTTVHASISKLSAAGRWAALPITIPEQNICQFIQKDKEYYPVLQRNSNLPKHCPIPKGQYTLNNAVLVAKKIPSFIPKGCFKVDLTINNKNLKHPSCYIVVAKIAGGSDSATPSCLA